VRPETLDGDWNRLYDEFPDVYDEFASVEHAPRAIDVIAERCALEDAVVIDVGAGTGRSTLQLAERAASVTGVEPNENMLAVARRRAEAVGARNVEFVAGDASDLPLASESADVVACFTTVFWPPEVVVPAFAAEAFRVLRPGGTLFTLNTAPGWYGGEFRDVVTFSPEYEDALTRALDAIGLDTFDFRSTQDYGTSERAVATYGFIFGGGSIDLLRARDQSTITWRWRVWHGKKPLQRPTVTP
jgi:ubiquinone/menaquinone biosynthesis C-methylase UbiE